MTPRNPNAALDSRSTTPDIDRSAAAAAATPITTSTPTLSRAAAIMPRATLRNRPTNTLASISEEDEDMDIGKDEIEESAPINVGPRHSRLRGSFYYFCTTARTGSHSDTTRPSSPASDEINSSKPKG